MGMALSVWGGLLGIGFRVVRGGLRGLLGDLEGLSPTVWGATRRLFSGLGRWF